MLVWGLAAQLRGWRAPWTSELPWARYAYEQGQAYRSSDPNPPAPTGPVTPRAVV